MRVEITDLSPSGPGVGRLSDGKTIFVPFSAPGDSVEVEVDVQKPRYSLGKLSSVLRPSPLRLKPKCPVFTECGGCQWQHIPYDVQWKAKLSNVRKALDAHHLASPQRVSHFPAQEVYGYRNRIQIHKKDESIGFFRSNSHDLVPTRSCDLAHPLINETLKSLSSHAIEDRSEILLSSSGSVSVRNTATRPFRQVNSKQNQELQKWICTIIESVPHTGHLLWDLYGGDGNLSQALFSAFDSISIVDSQFVPRTKPHPNHIHFESHGVVRFLQSQQRRTVPDFVIMDPPRTGLGKDRDFILNQLKKYRADRIILVGCSVKEWARDVRAFTQEGWSIQEIAIFDFFPQTVHVESAAFLLRSE